MSIAETRRSKLLIQTMLDLQQSRSKKGLFAFAVAGQSSWTTRREISSVGSNVTPSAMINAAITNSFSANTMISLSPVDRDTTKSESSSRWFSRSISARRRKRRSMKTFLSFLKEVHSRHERSGNTSALRAHRLDWTIETIGNARWPCRSFRSTDFTRRRNGMRKNNDLFDLSRKQRSNSLHRQPSHGTTTESGNVLGISLVLRIVPKTRLGCCSNDKTARWFVPWKEADCFWSMISLWLMIV